MDLLGYMASVVQTVGILLHCNIEPAGFGVEGLRGEWFGTHAVESKGVTDGSRSRTEILES